VALTVFTIVDSDVLIDYVNDRGSAPDQVESGLRAGALATTSVTAYELWSGIRDGRRGRALAAVLGEIGILPVDATAARRAADVRRALEAKGQTLPTPDLLIAGVCLAWGAPLLTRNRRHFERVPGLRLVPLEEPS
jgi:tRNA(fMet)-specific endonuclease VapC